MNVYEVSGRKTTYGNNIIEANSVYEAIAKFRELRPDLTPETVDTLRGTDPDDPPSMYYRCVGRCESCKREIVCSDDFIVDADYNYLCDKCYELNGGADGAATQAATVPF